MKSKTMTTDEALELADRLAEWLAPWATEGPRVACTVLSAEVRKLRAKIEHMEKQEPIAWTTELALELGSSALGFDACRGNLWGEKGVPLYALPGAQPEPNLSDTAIQKQLATQWGYVQKPHPDCDSGCMFQCAQPAPSLASGDVSLISEGKTQPAPSVLEGWPTEEMTTAFARVFNVRDQSGTFTPAFRAALAAAPEAKP